MIRKITAFFLLLILLFTLCSCSASEQIEENPSSDVPETIEVKNPFTGEIISKDKELLRPVAVVINNLNSAQGVQAGVADADIVYETQVEGGITRLLAVYKDISAAPLLGSIRSARVVFAQLALSHGAVFVHHGIDPNYAAEYVKKSGVTDFDTNKKPAAPFAFRKNNGLNTEHTVYSSPQLLSTGFKENSVATKIDRNTPWCSFSDRDRVPTDGQVYDISVKFSSSYVSNFSFSPDTGLYTKNSSKAQNADYMTDAPYRFKNVFVLHTDISFYPDGSHRRVNLDGGEGYYYSMGGYEKIIWRKTGNEPIKFFTPDGAELKVNVGKSWICITQKP